MSAEGIKWAREQKLASATLKSVLRELGSRADRHGCTWASQTEIADAIGVSVRTIQREMRLLEALGIISRRMRSKGRKGRVSDVINLSMHRQFALSKADIKAAKSELKEYASTRQHWREAEQVSNPPAVALPTRQPCQGLDKQQGLNTYPIQKEQNYQDRATGTHDGPPPLKVIDGGKRHA